MGDHGVTTTSAAVAPGQPPPPSSGKTQTTTWEDPLERRGLRTGQSATAAAMGMKRRRPRSLCQRLRLPWPFAAAATASDLDGEDGNGSDDGGGVDAATVAMRRLGLGLRSHHAAAEEAGGVPLRRSSSTASLSLSRVGSEGSDLSGYVIGADLSTSTSMRQPKQGSSGSSCAPGADNNVVVVQLECPRCQCIDRRVVPPSDDSAAAAAVAAAAAAAGFAVGAGGNVITSSALSSLPPASAAALAVERSGSTGSLSLLLDAGGASGRGSSGRLSRMPSFRLPSFSLLASAAPLPTAPTGIVGPVGPPVPSASALQLQHLLGVELTAEEQREQAEAAALRPLSIATAASSSLLSSSATSSEAASSEDGEEEGRATSPSGRLLEVEEEEEEEGGREVKAMQGRLEEEEGCEGREEDPHLALAREVVMELKRGEKLYRPAASFDAAAEVMVGPPKQAQQEGAGAAAGQLGLPPLMRAVILDWVLDIHARLKLGPQSLYLAVLILDRFTAQVSLDRPELQLLALASLLVASKHEDVTAPSIKTMLRFTENLPGSSNSTTPKAQLLHMERRVLEVLGFAFARPTTADFLDVLLGLGDARPTAATARHHKGDRGTAPPSQPWEPSAAAGAVLSGGGGGSQQQQQQMPQMPQPHAQAIPLLHARARYLAERALFDGGLVSRFAPSRIAAGAVYLARRHDTPDAWTAELEAWSGYSEGEALGMARRISRLAQGPLPLVGTRRLTALTRKYASARFREVAAMTCLPLP